MALRSLWTGSLSFGLINIPVKLYSAAVEKGLSFDMLDKTTHQPIGYSRVIRGTDKVVKWEDIVRGYKYYNDAYVVLTDEDFKKANPAKSRTIDIVQFVDQAEIDSKFYEKPYYLEPEPKSAKAYALLREALARSGRVAIATFVMRDREHLAAVKAEGNVLVLNQMRYAQEISGTKSLEIPGKEEVKERELEMALALIEQLTEHFDPERFRDTYTDELMALIEAKAKGKQLVAKPEAAAAPASSVDDLLAMLRESLRRTAASSKGKPRAAEAENGGGKQPAKRAAAAAEPARKSAAKKGAEPVAKRSGGAGAAARKQTATHGQTAARRK